MTTAIITHHIILFQSCFRSNPDCMKNQAEEIEQLKKEKKQFWQEGIKNKLKASGLKRKLEAEEQKVSSLKRKLQQKKNHA